MAGFWRALGYLACALGMIAAGPVIGFALMRSSVELGLIGAGLVLASAAAFMIWRRGSV